MDWERGVDKESIHHCITDYYYEAPSKVYHFIGEIMYNIEDDVKVKSLHFTIEKLEYDTLVTNYSFKHASMDGFFKDIISGWILVGFGLRPFDFHLS